MKFCDKCGSVVFPKKNKNKNGWYCQKCNTFVKDDKIKQTLISEKIKESEEKIKVFKKDDDLSQYPKTKIICDKCGNDEAYWFLQQTRGADEPQTKFLCCTKCKHKWREY